MNILGGDDDDFGGEEDFVDEVADEDIGEELAEDYTEEPAEDYTEEVSDEEASWRDLIYDQKLRGSVEKYNSLDDMIKAHNHLGGELKSKVALPGPDASEEEIEAYRYAAGVPETPEDYVIPDVEGYDYSEDDLAELEQWAEWALENNIPQNAFMELIRSRVESKFAVEQEHEKILIAEQEAADNALREEWGGDYDANIENAARAAHTFGGEDFVEALESIETDEGQLLGDLPQVVKFLSQVGRLLEEHNPAMLTTPGERMGVQDEINQIMTQNPPGSPGYSDPRTQSRLNQLYELLEGKNLISP